MNIKNMGQIFTPIHIVKETLDEIGFTKEKTLTHKIIEPSFGDGVFLVETVSRIINYGKRLWRPARPKCTAFRHGC